MPDVGPKSLRRAPSPTSGTTRAGRSSTTLTGRLTTPIRKRLRNRPSDEVALVYSSLDLLILRTLVWGPTHGHGIAKSIERLSDDHLKVDHGSLYPALQRLQQERLITGAWGVSKNHQRAKYYRLTPAGRRRLASETSRWERFVRAITGILQPAQSGEGT